MLESLSIRNLGLIAEAEVSFLRGLVVITGETGAGKTLLLEAIGALAGRRPSLAGTGADTMVDGELRLGAAATSQAADFGAAAEGGVTLVSRLFPAEGRAKAVLGGRPVPSSALAELAEQWLAVHGQHDTLRLLRPSAHRDLLDRHGGPELEQLLLDYRGRYQRWRTLEQELAAARAERANLLANLDALTADVNLCDSLNLQPGEDVEIAATIERLARSEQIRAAVAFAQSALGTDEGGAASAVAAAARELDHSIRGDQSIDALVARLRTVLGELGDIAFEVSAIGDNLELDPAALDSLMLRQRQIRTLMLRHGPTFDDLLTWLESARRQLRLADPAGEGLAELARETEAAQAEALRAAAVLTDARRRTADRLGSEVSAELRALAMPFAQFEVALEPSEPAESGADRVEFRFSANPGLPLQPIQQSASGGELSRLMLAIEVSIAEDASAADNSPVMVFDEVDAGVAGAAATAVAERLARLARHRQVLVVSHLAQIAAFADQQVKVEKDSDGLVTSTTVHTVAQSERRTEIARMLAGIEDSASAQAHADELLAAAKSMKGEARDD